MIRYELQKIFSRPSSKVALILLLLVVGVTTYFACHVKYVDEAGQGQYGLTAVRQLREDQKAWAGVLDEEKLRQAIQAIQDVVNSPEYQSEDLVQNEIAYHRQLALEPVRDLLNESFAPAFRSYDYFAVDTLTPEDAARFYSNRVDLLQAWLYDEADLSFSDQEKAYLLAQYDALDTPITVDYTTGWTQFCEYSPSVAMLAALIACYLVAGIFSSETQWKTDAIFFSSLHGRRKATAAKVKAGVLLLTAIYWASFLLFAAVTLLFLGTDGAGCPLQVNLWKSFYNLTLAQGALLIALGGYLGTLFLGLVAMWISAKSSSTVLAAVFPFALIFLPTLLLTGDIGALVSNILGLLPDRLLQINRVLGYFDLYSFGSKTVGALPILLVLYTLLSLLLLPLLYQSYRRKQLK